jgi:Trypsin
MLARRRLLAVTAVVFAAVWALATGARATQQADPLLLKLKRQAAPNGTPIAMVDRPGRPRGFGIPPRRRTTTIGALIRANPRIPPAKHLNVLDWHGFPKVNPPIGKVWAVRAGKRRFEPLCSGTVFARGVVVTAAHCLTDDRRRSVRAILFVPGQTWNDPDSIRREDVRARWRVWEGVQWWIPEGYRRKTVDLDWGVIELRPQGGRYIGDAVGTYRIQTGIRFLDRTRIWSYGYPAMGRWSRRQGYVGRGQYACETTWRGGALMRRAGGYELWIRCPMNGGASGGPWLVQLSSGEWVIAGVNNWCNDDVKADDEGPTLYCTPVSTDLRSLVFDARFVRFWRSIVPKLRF